MLLKIEGATHGFCDALELDEQAVAGRLDTAAPALGDRRIYELEPHGLQTSERSGLIDFHKSAVADPVSGKNCREQVLDIADFHGSMSRPSASTAHAEVRSPDNQV